jgi:hypothetical protein
MRRAKSFWRSLADTANESNLGPDLPTPPWFDLSPANQCVLSRIKATSIARPSANANGGAARFSPACCDRNTYDPMKVS